MTNWQMIIMLATLVFAVFSANWLSLTQLNKRIDDLKHYLDAEFKALRAEFRGEIGEVRAELRALAEKVGRIDRQMEALYKPALPGRGD